MKVEISHKEISNIGKPAGSEWQIKATFVSEDLKQNKRGLWKTIVSKLKEHPKNDFVQCFREFWFTGLKKLCRSFDIPEKCYQPSSHSTCTLCLSNHNEKTSKENKIVAELIVRIDNFQIKNKARFQEELTETFLKSLKRPEATLL